MPYNFLYWSPGTDPSGQIRDALTQAIAASAKTRYPLTDGKLIRDELRRYMYRFTLVQHKGEALPDDGNLMLGSADFERPIQVEVQELTNTTITLTVGQRLPARTLRQSSLVHDLGWLLRQLKDALTNQTDPSPIEHLLFGMGSPQAPISARLTDVNLERILRDVFAPDEYQRRAIERSLCEELLLIIGPPGTGKTQVLAASAFAHLLRRTSPRILILAHTNIALDNAIEQLVTFCQKAGKQSFLDERNVIRVGTPRLAALTVPVYTSVVLPLIVQEELRPTKQEIERLKQERDQLLPQLTAHQQEKQRLEYAWQAERNRLDEAIQALSTRLDDQRRCWQQALAVQRQAVDARRKQCAALEVHVAQAGNEARLATEQRIQAEQNLQVQELLVKRCEQDLARWQKKTRVGRYVARVNVVLGGASVEYHQALTNACARRDEAQLTLATTQRTERQWIQERAKTRERLNKARQKRNFTQEQLNRAETAARTGEAQLGEELKRYVVDRDAGEAPIINVRATLVTLIREKDTLEETLAQLDKELLTRQHDLSRELVNHAQVVGTTLTGLFLSANLLRQHWDVVIVDEASMVQIPAIQLAARCAGSHLILIGDAKQLAPVCRLPQPAIKYWLGTDIYTLGHYTLEEAMRGEHYCALLPYQSRMHPEICDLIRGPIYHHLLRDRDPQPPRLQLAPYPESPVVLYDTSGWSRTTRPKGGGSRQNSFHMHLVGRLVEEMLASLPLSLLKPECLGVVTPYRPQVHLLEEELLQRRVAEWVRVGTVHTFQGLEFVGVIFDTVDAPGVKLSPFTSNEWGSDAMRLINVAITRARDKLVLVANLDYQLKHAPVRYIMPQVLSIAEKKHVERA